MPKCVCFRRLIAWRSDDTVVLVGRTKNVVPVFIPTLSGIYLHVFALYESRIKFA